MKNVDTKERKERYRQMSVTYTVTEYDREDMLALENMTYSEVDSAIEDLDRGYFNRFVFPDYDDEFETYSEDDYRVHRIRVALRKVHECMEKFAAEEKDG